ncbi:MAG TPA: hypothetical protein VI316_00365 [Candidatus Dormibacteraeota bacterium]
MSKGARLRTSVDEIEDELSVEEVALRLGLPVAMLMRRIEAGTVPGRRLDGPDGVQYRVAASALPPPPETVEARPAAASEHGVWSEIAARRDGREAGGPSRSGDRPDVTPTLPVSGEVIAARGRPANPALQGGAVVARPAPQETVDMAREGLIGPGIDARELVAALLDRWERTHEQRVHAEYRLRYETLLADERGRQLRLRNEMDALRSQLEAAGQARDADAAAAVAAFADRDRDLATLREQLHTRLAAILERDRLIAERDRVTASRDRLIHQLRDELGQRDKLIGELRDQAARAPKQGRRRGGLFGS